MPQNPGKATDRLTHLVCVATLLATGLVVCQPLMRGGFMYYVDNAVHLAELKSLALDGGWSELSFCGFPLSTLHSPLWYGLLTMLVRAGISSAALYFGALYAGLVAPAIAIYWVGQRRVSPWVGLWVGYLVLVLPASIVGVASSLGGMWTFHLGCALLVLYADAIAESCLRPNRQVRSAALLALIALTHHFVLVAAVIMSLLNVVMRIRHADPKGRARALVSDVGVWASAALASLAYWGPTLSTLNPLASGGQDLPLEELGMRLLLPTDLIGLLSPEHFPGVRRGLYLSETLVVLGLVLAATLAWRSRRKHAQTTTETHSLFALGTIFSLSILLILCASTFKNIAVLGPLSWRYVAFVHLGLAIAAVSHPWQERPTPRVRKGRLTTLGLCMVASGLWWSRPLLPYQSAPATREANQLVSVWRWLADEAKTNAIRDPGRLYVQDIFTAAHKTPLDSSHVTSFTWATTHRPQLGSFYAVHPFPTGDWTESEFGSLFGSSSHDPQELLRRAARSNTSTVLLSFPRWKSLFFALPEFEQVYESGRFSVWNRVGPPPGWVSPEGSTSEVKSALYTRGRLDIDVEVTEPNARLLTAISFHDWWRLDTGGRLAAGADGLMNIEDLQVGRQELHLSWQAPLWPRVGSLFGWLLIAFVGFKRRTRAS